MHVGNYDECLEIDQKVKTNRIQGKYCTAFFGAHPKYGAGLSKLLDELMVTTKTAPNCLLTRGFRATSPGTKTNINSQKTPDCLTGFAYLRHALGRIYKIWQMFWKI